MGEGKQRPQLVVDYADRNGKKGEFLDIALPVGGNDMTAGAVVLAMLLWLGLFPSPLLSFLARLAPSVF